VVLVLPGALREAILAHARAAAPEEACGVLGGRDEGGARRVAAAIACRNVAAEPRVEFALDPREQVAAFLRIEDELRLEVVGFYHSHPRGPPRPSTVDAARAAYAGASHVVVWLAPKEGWGSWRWGPGFVEEPVEREAN
jgi:proteasome lid subunit RPN8/RPN11